MTKRMSEWSGKNTKVPPSKISLQKTCSPEECCLLNSYQSPIAAARPWENEWQKVTGSWAGSSLRTGHWNPRKETMKTPGNWGGRRKKEEKEKEWNHLLLFVIWLPVVASERGSFSLLPRETFWKASVARTTKTKETHASSRKWNQCLITK